MCAAERIRVVLTELLHQQGLASSLMCVGLSKAAQTTVRRGIVCMQYGRSVCINAHHSASQTCGPMTRMRGGAAGGDELPKQPQQPGAAAAVVAAD